MDLPTDSLQPLADVPDRVLPVDVDHGGIRLALPALTVLGFVVGYTIILLLLTALQVEGSSGCLAFVGGLMIALLTLTAGDRVLKRLWPSGRRLVLESGGLQLEDKRRGRQQATQMQWNQRINALGWRFKVSRGSARVPKGWLMLSLQLLQDDAELIVYTFMPEKEAATLPIYQEFTALVPRKQLESEQLPLRERGEQRRLLKVEQQRWQDGAEIRREDFVILIETLLPHVPDWQIRS
ncbi:MAG: hypothetical protein ABI947_22680 [Chloroflexota bacterium]